jgi:hypothetical protein
MRSPVFGFGIMVLENSMSESIQSDQFSLGCKAWMLIQAPGISTVMI